MNNIKIANILPGAIVSAIDRGKRRLYQVISIVKSDTDTYVLTLMGGNSVKLCSEHELSLEAILCSKTYIDPHGNEVTYDELLRRQELA